MNAAVRVVDVEDGLLPVDSDITVEVNGIPATKSIEFDDIWIAEIPTPELQQIDIIATAQSNDSDLSISDPVTVYNRVPFTVRSEITINPNGREAYLLTSALNANLQDPLFLSALNLDTQQLRPIISIAELAENDNTGEISRGLPFLTSHGRLIYNPVNNSLFFGVLSSEPTEGLSLADTRSTLFELSVDNGSILGSIPFGRARQSVGSFRQGFLTGYDVDTDSLLLWDDTGLFRLDPHDPDLDTQRELISDRGISTFGVNPTAYSQRNKTTFFASGTRQLEINILTGIATDSRRGEDIVPNIVNISATPDQAILTGNSVSSVGVSPILALTDLETTNSEFILAFSNQRPDTDLPGGFLSGFEYDELTGTAYDLSGEPAVLRQFNLQSNDINILSPEAGGAGELSAIVSHLYVDHDGELAAGSANAIAFATTNLSNAESLTRLTLNLFNDRNAAFLRLSNGETAMILLDSQAAPRNQINIYSLADTNQAIQSQEISRPSLFDEETGTALNVPHIATRLISISEEEALFAVNRAQGDLPIGIYRLNLTSGAVNPVSTNTRGLGSGLNIPIDLFMLNDRVFVVDKAAEIDPNSGEVFGAIYELDLISGNRTTIANRLTGDLFLPNTGTPIPSRNSILIGAYNPEPENPDFDEAPTYALFSVDVDTGAVDFVSAPPLSAAVNVGTSRAVIESIGYDEDTDTALVAIDTGAILAYSFITNEWTYRAY